MLNQHKHSSGLGHILKLMQFFKCLRNINFFFRPITIVPVFGRIFQRDSARISITLLYIRPRILSGVRTVNIDHREGNDAPHHLRTDQCTVSRIAIVIALSNVRPIRYRARAPLTWTLPRFIRFEDNGKTF